MAHSMGANLVFAGTNNEESGYSSNLCISTIFLNRCWRQFDFVVFSYFSKTTIHGTQQSLLRSARRSSLWNTSKMIKESSNVWFPPCSKPLLRACSILLDHDILFLSSEKRLDPPQGLPSPLSSPHRPTILVSLVTSTTTSVAIKFPNQPPILPGVRWPSKLGSAALAPTLLLNNKHLKHQLCKWSISNFANGQLSDEWSCEDFTWATLLFSVRPLLPVEKDNAAREWLRAWTFKGFKIVSKQEKESVALPLFVSTPQRLTAGDEDGGWCRPVCAKQDYLFSSWRRVLV